MFSSSMFSSFQLSGENKYNATLTVDISLTTFEHNTNMAKPTVEPRVGQQLQHLNDVSVVIVMVCILTLFTLNCRIIVR
jgi:hypothetical protein